jgi:hypothetical protein
MSPTERPKDGSWIKLPAGFGKLKLPKWGVWGLTISVLIYSFVWVWDHGLEDIVNPATVEMSKEGAVQMAESQKHIVETAASEVTMVNGSIIKYYSSDKCIAVFRQIGAGYKPYFLLDPTRLMPDGPMTLLGSVEMIGAGFMGSSPCQRRCIDPHPGVFYEELNHVNECILEIYREWEEGCAHVQPYNKCTDEWGAVEWLCCVH